MYALNRMSLVTGQASYNDLAIQLAKSALHDRDHFGTRDAVMLAHNFDSCMQVYIRTLCIARPVQRSRISGGSSALTCRGQWCSRRATWVGSQSCYNTLQSRLYCQGR